MPIPKPVWHKWMPRIPRWRQMVSARRDLTVGHEIDLTVIPYQNQPPTWRRSDAHEVRFSDGTVVEIVRKLPALGRHTRVKVRVLHASPQASDLGLQEGSIYVLFDQLREKGGVTFHYSPGNDEQTG